MFIKNTLNEKNVYTLLIKNTPLYPRLGSKQKKLLGTAKKLIRKNSIYCLKNQAIFFHRIERTDRLDSPSPCSFSFAF